MPTLYIRQDLLASNARTIIKNEEKEPQYLLVGRWGTRGDVLSLYAMNGEIIASIKQATFAFTRGARFDLYEQFEKVGSLQRILSFNRDFYYVHHLGWVVIGNIRQQEYSIFHLNRRVMTMKRATLPDGEFYTLDIDRSEDAPLCICIAAVLNYWLQNRQLTEAHIRKYFPDLSFNN